jgi:hypothetical protein
VQALGGLITSAVKINGIIAVAVIVAYDSKNRMRLLKS